MGYVLIGIVALLLLSPLTLLIHRKPPEPELEPESEPAPEPEPPKPEPPKPKPPKIPAALRQNIIDCPSDYTVIDFETTGLDPVTDEIIEVGALRVRNHNIVATYAQLISPGRILPTEIVELTGIDDAMLAGQPVIADILPGFVDFLGDDIIIGHNVTFDLQFLAVARDKCALGKKDYKWIDTCSLARTLYPDAPKYSLASLATYLKIGSPSHRANTDMQVTYALYMHETADVLKYDKIWPPLKAQYNVDAPADARSAWARPTDEKGADLMPLKNELRWCDDSVRKYYYTDVRALRDDKCDGRSVAAGTSCIVLYSDLDKRANIFEVGHPEKPIGYLPQNRLADMVCDYTHNADMVLATADSISAGGAVNLLEMAFYMEDGSAADGDFGDDGDDDFSDD